MVKAFIAIDAQGKHEIWAQRAKFKWWFILGKHKPTDNAFYKAYEESQVEWGQIRRTEGNLF